MITYLQHRLVSSGGLDGQVKLAHDGVVVAIKVLDGSVCCFRTSDNASVLHLRSLQNNDIVRWRIQLQAHLSLVNSHLPFRGFLLLLQNFSLDLRA